MYFSQFGRKAVFVAILISSCLIESARSQERKAAPDLSVNNVKLGDRISARKFLDGYQFRTDEGIPTYYFYNSYVTTVLKLTGSSFEDPYFIRAIEVYNVGPDYQKKHFVLEKTGHFLTESGIHVGFRQSGADIAFSLTVGIPGIVGDSITRTKYVIKKIGEPTERIKEGEVETFRYTLDNVALPNTTGENGQRYKYTANYRFVRNKLNRFSMQIMPASVP